MNYIYPAIGNLYQISGSNKITSNSVQYYTYDRDILTTTLNTSTATTYFYNNRAGSTSGSITQAIFLSLSYTGTFTTSYYVETVNVTTNTNNSITFVPPVGFPDFTFGDIQVIVASGITYPTSGFQLDNKVLNYTVAPKMRAISNVIVPSSVKREFTARARLDSRFISTGQRVDLLQRLKTSEKPLIPGNQLLKTPPVVVEGWATRRIYSATTSTQDRYLIINTTATTSYFTGTTTAIVLTAPLNQPVFPNSLIQILNIPQLNFSASAGVVLLDEGLSPAGTLVYWSPQTTFSMTYGNLGSGSAHGYVPSTSFVLTYPNLPNHTQMRYSFNWHFVDSVDSETSWFEIDGLRYFQFTKSGVVGAPQNISVDRLTPNSSNGGGYAWSGVQTYSYRPFYGGSQGGDGYITIDTGWINHFAGSVIINHFIGVDQVQTDEASYISHAKLQVRGNQVSLPVNFGLGNYLVDSVSTSSNTIFVKGLNVFTTASGISTPSVLGTVTNFLNVYSVYSPVTVFSNSFTQQTQLLVTGKIPNQVERIKAVVEAPVKVATTNLYSKIRGVVTDNYINRTPNLRILNLFKEIRVGYRGTQTETKVLIFNTVTVKYPLLDNANILKVYSPTVTYGDAWGVVAKTGISGVPENPNVTGVFFNTSSTLFTTITADSTLPQFFPGYQVKIQTQSRGTVELTPITSSTDVSTRVGANAYIQFSGQIVANTFQYNGFFGVPTYYEAWVNLNNSNGGFIAMEQQSSWDDSINIAFGIGPALVGGGTRVFMGYNTGYWSGWSTWYIAASTNQVTPGRWTHIAGSWDGGTFRVYINGTLEGSSGTSGQLQNGGFGYVNLLANNGGGEIFDGSIFNFRIINTITTVPPSVLALPGNGFAGPTGQFYGGDIVPGTRMVAFNSPFNNNNLPKTVNTTTMIAFPTNALSVGTVNFINPQNFNFPQNVAFIRPANTVTIVYPEETYEVIGASGNQLYIKGLASFRDLSQWKITINQLNNPQTPLYGVTATMVTRTREIGKVKSLQQLKTVALRTQVAKASFVNLFKESLGNRILPGSQNSIRLLNFSDVNFVKNYSSGTTTSTFWTERNIFLTTSTVVGTSTVLTLSTAVSYLSVPNYVRLDYRSSTLETFLTSRESDYDNPLQGTYGNNVVGAVEFTSAGTYTFFPPPGVTEVHVVCIGAGARGGRFNFTGDEYAGGGGGLGWRNNIPVAAGQGYTVVVGSGNGAGYVEGADGGDSYFISTATVAGLGGKTGRIAGTTGTTIVGTITNLVIGFMSGAGGGYVGDGGGRGGRGFSGGGGAGGYFGSGGDGGQFPLSSTTFDGLDAQLGSGGAGGGGGAGDATASWYFYRAGGGGSGTGYYGINLTGRGGFRGNTPTFGSGLRGQFGIPGSHGQNAEGNSNNPIGGSGGFPGGGGGRSERPGAYGTAETHGGGGNGAVRIMWGKGRSYPYNTVPSVGTSVRFNGTSDYISIPYAFIRPVSRSSPQMVEAWVMPGQTTNGMIIASEEYTGGSNSINVVLGLSNSPPTGSGNRAWFGFYTGATWYTAVGITQLQTNTWYHVAGQYDGNQLRIYVNGNLEGTTVVGLVNLNDFNGNLFFIGKRWDNGVDTTQVYFNGHLYGVRVINEVIMYTGKFTPQWLGYITTIGQNTLLACTDKAPMISVPGPGTYISNDYRGQNLASLAGSTGTVKLNLGNATGRPFYEEKTYNVLSASTNTLTIDLPLNINLDRFNYRVTFTGQNINQPQQNITFTTLLDKPQKFLAIPTVKEAKDKVKADQFMFNPKVTSALEVPRSASQKSLIKVRGLPLDNLNKVARQEKYKSTNYFSLFLQNQGLINKSAISLRSLPTRLTTDKVLQIPRITGELSRIISGQTQIRNLVKMPDDKSIARNFSSFSTTTEFFSQIDIRPINPPTNARERLFFANLARSKYGVDLNVQTRNIASPINLTPPKTGIVVSGAGVVWVNQAYRIRGTNLQTTANLNWYTADDPRLTLTYNTGTNMVLYFDNVPAISTVLSSSHVRLVNYVGYDQSFPIVSYTTNSITIARPANFPSISTLNAYFGSAGTVDQIIWNDQNTVPVFTSNLTFVPITVQAEKIILVSPGVLTVPSRFNLVTRPVGVERIRDYSRIESENTQTYVAGMNYGLPNTTRGRFEYISIAPGYKYNTKFDLASSRFLTPMSIETGKTLLSFINGLGFTGPVDGNNGSGPWLTGHANLPYTFVQVGSFSNYFSRGTVAVMIGDGSADGSDQAVFYFNPGNAGGDFDGNAAFYAFFGGENSQGTGYLNGTVGTIWGFSPLKGYRPLFVLPLPSGGSFNHYFAGWYSAGNTVTSGNGKRSNYDTFKCEKYLFTCGNTWNEPTGSTLSDMINSVGVNASIIQADVPGASVTTEIYESSVGPVNWFNNQMSPNNIRIDTLKTSTVLKDLQNNIKSNNIESLETIDTPSGFNYGQSRQNISTRRRLFFTELAPGLRKNIQFETRYGGLLMNRGYSLATQGVTNFDFQEKTRVPQYQQIKDIKVTIKPIEDRLYRTGTARIITPLKRATLEDRTSGLIRRIPSPQHVPHFKEAGVYGKRNINSVGQVRGTPFELRPTVMNKGVISVRAIQANNIRVGASNIPIIRWSYHKADYPILKFSTVNKGTVFNINSGIVGIGQDRNRRLGNVRPPFEGAGRRVPVQFWS